MKKQIPPTRRCSDLKYRDNVIFKRGDLIRKGSVTYVDKSGKKIYVMSMSCIQPIFVNYDEMIAVYNSMSPTLWTIDPNEATFPGDKLIPE